MLLVHGYLDQDQLAMHNVLLSFGQLPYSELKLENLKQAIIGTVSLAGSAKKPCPELFRSLG